MTLKRKVSAAFRARNLFPKLTGYNLQNSTCISMANQMYIHIFLSSFCRRLDFCTVPNLSPTNKSPMFLYSSAQGNFFANGSANGRSKANFSQICLYGNNTSSSRQRADVYHQNFIFTQLGYFGRFFVTFNPYAQKSAK